jgi:hypothetical protein
LNHLKLKYTTGGHNNGEIHIWYEQRPLVRAPRWLLYPVFGSEWRWCTTRRKVGQKASELHQRALTGKETAVWWFSQHIGW